MRIRVGFISFSNPEGMTLLYHPFVVSISRIIKALRMVGEVSEIGIPE
jgi:hypothetical protein